VNVEVTVTQVPLLDGVIETVMQQVRSSLHENNLQSASDYENFGNFDDSQLAPLVDPQTCGGLVAAVPKARVDDCVNHLREAGYLHAAQIGMSVEAERSRLL
jgi:selenide,water dikinase